MSRFRIATSDSYGRSFDLPFTLQKGVMRTRWFRPDEEVWCHIGYFKTRDDAKARYELIKDLPEYLS